MVQPFYGGLWFRGGSAGVRHLTGRAAAPVTQRLEPTPELTSAPELSSPTMPKMVSSQPLGITKQAQFTTQAIVPSRLTMRLAQNSQRE
jgi:hypothetical protein